MSSQEESFSEKKNLSELLMFSCRQGHVFLKVRHIKVILPQKTKANGVPKWRQI